MSGTGVCGSSENTGVSSSGSLSEAPEAEQADEVAEAAEGSVEGSTGPAYS